MKTVRSENDGTVLGDYFIARFTNTLPRSICSRISEISSTVGARNSETSGATSSSNPVAAWILATGHFDHRIQFMRTEKSSVAPMPNFVFYSWRGLVMELLIRRVIGRQIKRDRNTPASINPLTVLRGW